MILDRLSSFKSRTILIGGGCALVFFSLYLKELSKDNPSSLDKAIGKIVRTKNEVSRRYETQLLWNEVPNKAYVFQSDTIRTGNNSSVEIHLRGDQKIYLGENSLVVLEFFDNQFNLSLAEGELEIQGQVNTNLGADTELRSKKDSIIKIKKNSFKGKNIIHSAKGENTLKTKDGLLELKEEQVLVRGNESSYRTAGQSEQLTFTTRDTAYLKGVQKSFRTLRAEYVSTSTKRLDVQKIAWQPLESADYYEVRINSKTLKTPKPSFAFKTEDYIRLNQPKISVRAVGKNLTGDWVEVSPNADLKKLAVVFKNGPSLLYPVEKSRVLDKEKEIHLLWKDSGLNKWNPDFYEIQVIAKNGGWKKSFKSTDNRWGLPIPPPGRYTWSVRPHWPDLGFAKASSQREFEVVESSFLSAPKIRRPASK